MSKSNIIKESELILNPDDTIYHLRIGPENLANTVILVGDPNRVEIISENFDKIEFKGQNREICTHTGYFRNKRITVMSTGMGTDNIDIVLNELDALVNIDLKTRTLKPEKTKLNLIRLGTSGGVQPHIPLNAFIVSEYGVGLDGLLYFYDHQQGVLNKELTVAFKKHFNWNESLADPYATSASDELLKMFHGENVYNGITLTAPGFYGPQGRELRIPLAYPDFNERLKSFNYQALEILNYEMETSALYALSNILGHRALTVCVAIANRERREYNQNYKEAVKELIELLLNKIVSLEE